jgi:hypothetical protein
MTAPDPGLTDLIAAEVGTHVVETVTAIDQLPWSYREGRDGYLLDCRCGAEVNCPQAEFNAAPVDSTSGALAYMIREHVAAHVASVVEQHTNGRMAELEAAVRKRIQLLREHDGFGAAHADGYMGMNWTAYYEGANQAQVMAAADLENDLRAALEGEQQ